MLRRFLATVAKIRRFPVACRTKIRLECFADGCASWLRLGPSVHTATLTYPCFPVARDSWEVPAHSSCHGHEHRRQQEGHVRHDRDQRCRSALRQHRPEEGGHRPGQASRRVLRGGSESRRFLFVTRQRYWRIEYVFRSKKSSLSWPTLGSTRFPIGSLTDRRTSSMESTRRYASAYFKKERLDSETHALLSKNVKSYIREKRIS